MFWEAQNFVLWGYVAHCWILVECAVFAASSLNLILWGCQSLMNRLTKYWFSSLKAAFQVAAYMMSGLQLSLMTVNLQACRGWILGLGSVFLCPALQAALVVWYLVVLHVAIGGVTLALPLLPPWYWFALDPPGHIQQKGSVFSCVGCTVMTKIVLAGCLSETQSEMNQNILQTSCMDCR